MPEIPAWCHWRHPVLHCWLWLFLYTASCTAGEPAPRAGDLIFREGTEPVSETVLGLDGGAFSHVGLLFEQEGHWQVIHSTPGSGEARDSGVVVDTLTFFTAPERSRRYAIYRVYANDAQRRRAIQWARAQIGTPFAILGDRGIYCTMLVWQAWRHAGVDLEARFSHLDIPLAGGEFLLPSGLLVSPRLTLIAPHVARAPTGISGAWPPAP